MTIAPSGGKPGTCPTCGAENAPGSRFCERCGTRLPPASREAAGPTPAAPTDATLTFDRPQVGTPRGDQDQAAAAAPAVESAEKLTEERPVAPEAASEREEQPPVARDAPTMSFDLPSLPAPEASEPRSAATLSFDLPSWAKEGEGDRAEPAETQAAETQAAETGWPGERGVSTPATDAPTPAQEGKSWDYQPWTPQSPEEQAAAAPPPRDVEGTRPAIVLQPQQPGSGAAETPPPAGSGTLPPEQPGTPTPPAQSPTQPQGSGWYGSTTPPPAQAQGQGQGSYTYPSPPPGPSGGQLPPTTGSATPPAYGYPQSGATAWSPPNTGAYPAPAVGNSNRTLWIILGVVGGLLLLCAMICVLIFLVGVASAASTGAVATGVATTTRP